MTEQFQKLITKLNAQSLREGWYEALCPFHYDHNPSLAFNNERFHCMACEKQGPLSELEKLLVA